MEWLNAGMWHLDGECLTNELNARILGASPHMERFEGAHLGEQLLQKVNTDPASFYWHFTVLGSFYVSKYVSAKMDAIIATSFPCFNLSNLTCGIAPEWGIQVMAAGSDLGYPIIVTWQCVLYLLQCVFCICCGVFWIWPWRVHQWVSWRVVGWQFSASSNWAVGAASPLLCFPTFVIVIIVIIIIIIIINIINIILITWC